MLSHLKFSVNGTENGNFKKILDISKNRTIITVIKKQQINVIKHQNPKKRTTPYSVRYFRESAAGVKQIYRESRISSLRS